MTRARGIDPRTARRDERLLDIAVCRGAAVSLPGLALRWTGAQPPAAEAMQRAMAAAELLRVDALAALGWRDMGVPPVLLGDSQRRRTASIRSLVLHGVCASITSAFASHGVRHAFLKGALMDALFWQGSGLRGVADIDVLVHPSDERRAATALAPLGFRRGLRPKRLATDDAKQERLFPGKIHGEAVFLDLHVGVARDPPYRDPGIAILERSVVHDTALGPMPGPTHEDALLQASVNLATAKFASGRLKLMLDAACYCAFTDVDLAIVVERAREAGCAWALWALLSLVEERFAVDVPGDVLAALEPSPSRAVLARRLAGVGCLPRVPASPVGRVVVEWPLSGRRLWPAQLFLRWVRWRGADYARWRQEGRHMPRHGT